MYKCRLNDKEVTKIENVFAARNPSFGSGGKDDDEYFYKLSYQTTKESEKFNVHFVPYYGTKPYFILGSSYEGVFNSLTEDDELYDSIIVAGSKGRNVKIFSDDTPDFKVYTILYDDDYNDIKRKIVTDEGYTFSQNQWLIIMFSVKCKLKVTGERAEAFPDVNFYLESDLSYDGDIEKIKSDSNDNNGKGLGGGAIAGIVIACIVVVAVICAVVWWLKFYNNTEEIKNNEENEKPEEDKNEGFSIDKSNTEV